MVFLFHIILVEHYTFLKYWVYKHLLFQALTVTLALIKILQPTSSPQCVYIPPGFAK